MVGKGALIVILGFSIIFGLASRYWNKTSREATENFVDYYDSTAAHNIAVSAANIAADSVFRNPSNTNLDLSGPFSGGTYEFITCWKVVNGDSDILVTATGTYPGIDGDIVDTVQVLLSPTRFSRYAFFSNNENSTYWITGDTLTGPYHTNGTMFISGVPVINGSVTTLNGTNPTKLPDSNGDTLKCTSYQSGVSITIPTSFTQAEGAASNTLANPSTSTSSNWDVYLTLNSNGTVSFHTVSVIGSSKGGSTTTRVPATGDSTVALSVFAPSGVVLVNNGDAHIQGTLKGQLTVIAEQGKARSSTSSFSSNGNILVTGNITYSNDPQTSPGSTDMLGLLADNNVMVTTQTQTNLTIDAAIFARLGTFSYQNYSSGSPMGYLNVYGSITNNTRGPVGTFYTGTHTLSTGYLKDYKYDPRFANSAPPMYPSTGQFQILSWRE